MSAKQFVDSNIWLYALFQQTGESVDMRHQKATDFLQQRERPAINSHVMREVCSNLIKKAELAEEKIQKLIAGWYSEDMQHGQVVQGRLTIVNPFLG